MFVGIVPVEIESPKVEASFGILGVYRIFLRALDMSRVPHRQRTLAFILLAYDTHLFGIRRLFSRRIRLSLWDTEGSFLGAHTTSTVGYRGLYTAQLGFRGFFIIIWGRSARLLGVS